MDKKQRISWGVSFGSVALVAGMVSYLGLSNGFKSNNVPAANNQQVNQNADGQNQSLFGNDDFNNSNNNNSNNGFSDDNSSSFDNGNSFNGNGSFQGGFGRHSRHQGGGFDTTTGGS